MEIGQQIRKYREKENYSQEYLAEKLYVSRQTISNWENERSYPDIHNLLMMCTLFNVSLDDLVKGDVKRMEHEEIKKTWILDVDDANLDVISMCFNWTAFILFKLVGCCDYLCHFSIGFIVLQG